MKVSVIVPYNKDRGFLKRCVDSINAQSYPVEMILAHSSGTFAENFNSGLARATGDYLKFVNEDDWLPEDGIKHLVAGMGNNPWICANSYQRESQITWIYKSEVTDLYSMIKKNTIHCGTVLYRTDIIRDIGGMDESLLTAEDYEMHLRLFSKGYIPGYIDKEVYYHMIWRKQKSRIMKKENKQLRDERIKKIQSLYSDKV